MDPVNGKPLVLLVEDEEPLRRLVSAILRKSGFTVIDAGDGEQALCLWFEWIGQIDLLITDITLGSGLSGTDVAAECRKLRPTLPVIFASGNLEETNEKYSPLVANHTYISKPYSLDALRAAAVAALPGLLIA